MIRSNWRLAVPGSAFNLALLGVVTAACSTENGEILSSKTQAVTGACVRGQACEVTIDLPSGVNGEDLAISAKEGIVLGSGTVLSTGDGKFAGIASKSGEVRVEASSTVGTVFTPDKVFVGGNSKVTGKLFAGSTEIQAGADVPAAQAPMGSPNEVSWSVTFPPTSGANVNLEPDRTDTLAPGNYGSLRVASRSTLKLSTGTYYFDTMQLEPQSVLELDTTGGTVVINVLGGLTHRGRIISLGAPSDVLVVVHGQGQVEIGDEFDGTLIAPNAEVSVARPTSGAHDAQLFARKVLLQGGVQLTATPASASGPAIDDLDADYTPSGDVVPPVPIPEYTGQSFEEWEAERAAFITALIEAGYNGPTIVLPPHPDATKVPEASDFAVPANATLTQRDAPAIPPRETGKIRQGAMNYPVTDPRARSETVYRVEPAITEFQQDIANAESEIVQKPGYHYLGLPDGTDDTYGTPPEELDVPEGCVFTVNEEPPNPADFDGEVNSDGENPFAIQDLFEPITFGNRPSYLVKEDPEVGSKYKVSGTLPPFDGYWFFEAGAVAGWNGEGMQGRIYAGTYAGIVAMKHHQELLRLYIDAEGAILRQDPSTGEVGPYFASELDFQVLGQDSIFGIDLPNWDVQNDVTRTKLKTTLLHATLPMFTPDSAAPRVQVGPFALILNGGAEVKLPLALDLDKNGPELTFAPLFRVYVTIFAGADVVIARLGVTGEADMIRVDMPFKAKVKWRNYREPETCYSSADVGITYQTKWSTLNGNLKVSVSAWVPIIGQVDIVDEEIVSWNGLEFDTGEVNLLPTWSLPLQTLPASQCTLGSRRCATHANADWSVPLDLPANTIVPVPHSNEECPKQFIAEVDMTGRNLDDLYLTRQWASGSVGTKAECEDAIVNVAVFRKVNGQWEEEPFDSYRVTGAWDETFGVCQTVGAGKIGPGENNVTLGYPRSWVDTSGNVEKVRFVLAGGAQCGQRELSIGVRATP